MWTRERWQLWGASHSPKLQDHWNLTIRLFYVISRTRCEGLIPRWRCCRCILQSQPTGQRTVLWFYLTYNCCRINGFNICPQGYSYESENHSVTEVQTHFAVAVLYITLSLRRLTLSKNTYHTYYYLLVTHLCIARLIAN